MDKDTRDKYYLIVIALGTGTLMFLEGMGVTQITEIHNDPPHWGPIIVGVIFLLAGVSIIFAGNSKINHLLASIITALMGALFGYTALFSDPDAFSGIGVQIALFVGVPMGNILFGLVSLLCFSISFYALRLSVRKAPNNRMQLDAAEPRR